MESSNHCLPSVGTVDIWFSDSQAREASFYSQIKVLGLFSSFLPNALGPSLV
jgi:hypothetical protein